MASTYNILPDKLCWQYTPKQLVYLYGLITKREVRETNRLYRMIMVTKMQDPPDKFLELIPNKKQTNKEGDTEQAGKASIGVASEEYTKNFNPNLQIIRNEANQEGDE